MIKLKFRRVRKMKKYKVSYSGFAYVEAENMQEAKEKFEYDDSVYQEQAVDNVEEIDDFLVSM